MPAASATAEPPLDPPGVRARSYGLAVRPSIVRPHANGWVVVLPSTMAPASRARRTASASASGTRPASTAAPHAVSTPALSKMSLTASGMPHSGPPGSPRAHSRSARRASSRARSRHSALKAPS